MPPSRITRLGEILVARGVCAPQRITEALEHQVAFEGRLGTNLMELGAVTEEQLARALSVQHRLPATWGAFAVDPGALAAVPPAKAQRWQAVPLRLDRRCLDVLVSEVSDPTRLDELAFAVGREVRPVLVAESRLWELLHRYYGVVSPLRLAQPRPREPGARVVEAPAPRGAPPQRAEPQLGELLVSNLEMLAELQGTAGNAGRATAEGELAPSPTGLEVALVTDETLLAELQDDASRRYRPALAIGVTSGRPAIPVAPRAAGLPPGTEGASRSR